MHREAGYDARTESCDGLDDLWRHIRGLAGIFERRESAWHRIDRAEGCFV